MVGVICDMNGDVAHRRPVGFDSNVNAHEVCLASAFTVRSRNKGT